MDYTLSFDKYIKFEKNEAYDLYCDEKNLIRFKRILIILTIIMGVSLIGSALSFFNSTLKFFNIFRLIFYLIFFVITFLLLTRYKKFFNISNIRRRIIVIIITLIISFTFFASISLISLEDLNFSDKITQKNQGTENTKIATGDSSHIAEKTVKKDSEDIQTNKKKTITLKTSEENNESKFEYSLYFCLIIVFLYFSKSEYIQLYSLAFGLPFISQLLIIPAQVFGSNLPQLIIFFSTTLLFFIISNTLNTKRQKKFFRSYDYYLKKNYESLRIKKELDYARQLQLSMLPESQKIINEVSISAISIPAMEVGGDYYDYFELSDGKVGIFICDVSGHGVASALLLSGIRSSIHLILEETHNPCEIFRKLNVMIRKTQHKKMFVTALFAVIDTKNDLISFFNAGHLPPYRIDYKNKELYLLKKHGVTLGVFENILLYNNGEVIMEFKYGDKFILYTDGLNEALNKNREEYGFERIENLLNKNLNSSSEEILSRIIEDVNNFMAGTEQIDDLTVVVVERIKSDN